MQYQGIIGYKWRMNVIYGKYIYENSYLSMSMIGIRKGDARKDAESENPK